MKVKNIEINYSWPFSLILFLAFFFAKIFDKIDWSWWWVFSPLWFPLLLLVGIAAIAGLIYVCAIIIGTILSWKS